MKAKKQKTGWLVSVLPSLIAFLIVAVPISIATVSVKNTSGEQAKKIAEDSIRRAIMNCYAREGSYPTSLEYLEENYGLHINENYIVHYTYVGGNLPPELMVVEAG